VTAIWLLEFRIDSWSFLLKEVIHVSPKLKGLRIEAFIGHHLNHIESDSMEILSFRTEQ
jgi:hypothetical protein